MKMKVNLRSSNQTFRPNFGQIIQVDDGGYERGYAAGHEEGFASGHEEGFEAGESSGYTAGYEEGFAAGESSGYGGFPIGDGNTHIWIHLEEGRTSPMLAANPNGTVTVDWGDGTEPDILTGTSIGTEKLTPVHQYAKPGDYIITLSVDGNMSFFSSSRNGAPLRYGNNDNRNNAYWGAIQKVEMGNNVTVRPYAFYNCYNLKSVVIPDSVTSIGDYAFGYCYSLQSIDIPDSATNIGDYAFSYCYSLQSIDIPDSATNIGSSAFSKCSSLTHIAFHDEVTSIGGYAFNGCFGVRFYDFTQCTAVPTLASTSAFDYIASDCEIRVPAALADEWKAATNWATYADYIVGV